MSRSTVTADRVRPALDRAKKAPREIDIHEAVIVLPGYLKKVDEVEDASVVDPDIQPTELGGRVGSCFEVRTVGHVTVDVLVCSR